MTQTELATSLTRTIQANPVAAHDGALLLLRAGTDKLTQQAWREVELGLDLAERTGSTPKNYDRARQERAYVIARDLARLNPLDLVAHLNIILSTKAR